MVWQSLVSNRSGRVFFAIGSKIPCHSSKTLSTHCTCLASVDIMMRRWQYKNATWWGVFIPVCVSMHVFMCMCACVWWRSQIICRLLKMFISLHNTNQTARQTSSVQIHFIAALLRREEVHYKTWFKVSLTFFSQQFQSSIQHCISLQNIILALLLWLPLPSFEIASFLVLW